MIIFIGEKTDPRKMLEKFETLTGERAGVFKKTATGKPVLERGAKPLYVSVSHSAEVMAVAVSESPVGIDIEKKREIAAQRIAARFFDDKSKTEVGRRGADAFFEIWTQKEACAKHSDIPLAAAMRSECRADNYGVLEDFALAVAGVGERYFCFCD